MLLLEILAFAVVAFGMGFVVGVSTSMPRKSEPVTGDALPFRITPIDWPDYGPPLTEQESAELVKIASARRQREIADAFNAAKARGLIRH